MPALDAETLSDGELSPDSLFDEPREPPPSPPKPPQAGARTASTENTYPDHVIARRSAPPIPGLYFDPALLLPADLADSTLRACMSTFFADRGDQDRDRGGVNQVMLFGRAGRESAAFPPFLSSLLAATSALLLRHPALPRETHAMLFGTPHEHARGDERERPRARQAIVNLYRPGEGISPHVDLLRRFGDGIVGVSLGGGAAMRFAQAETETSGGAVGSHSPSPGPRPPLVEGRRGGGRGENGHGNGNECEVWLPPRSVLVLTGEARYAWTHGIAPRVRDRVEDTVDGGGWQWQERGVRVSVTFRWLLPGAEIVGCDSDSEDVQTDAGGQEGGANEKGVGGAQTPLRLQTI